MKATEKIRVAVLYGGRSVEHEVSLQSASNVIQHLDTSRFEVIPIGIDKQGNWFLGDETFTKSLENNAVSQLSDESHAWFAPEWIGNPHDKALQKNLTLSNAKGAYFDVVFPAVHGSLCEDGSLQGLLDVASLPYVGCGVLSSAVGMDKDVAKRLASHAGINIVPYLVVKKGLWQSNVDELLKQVKEKLHYPVFVKPANTGSSIGITKVKAEPDLLAALDFAFQFDNKVLIEKALDVIELEIAVLESLDTGREPIVSVVGEIKPRHEFYSYDAKYTDNNGAELLIPAPVSETIKEQAQRLAKKLFSVLECEGMARIDLFLDKNNQQIYFNEINTLPGFTQISMYPKLMHATGIEYTDLLTHLIHLAMNRQKNKNQLIRNYVQQG